MSEANNPSSALNIQQMRGDSHLLLIGDPGTGKSQLLKYAAKIYPRTVYTTGIGCTTAGLTVAAVKDGGEWHLEAGALIMADEGLCCIDEFNSIREHDRGSIHEAMEQQTISVAKAGMIYELNSRCSIIATSNFKGKFNPEDPMSANVGISTPLLSRFDLVLLILDANDENWDLMVSQYILKGRKVKSRSTNTSDNSLLKRTVWPLDYLQAYFCLIKSLQPSLSQDACTVISHYYQWLRQKGQKDNQRVTVRALESIIRLSEAHAKLLFKNEVTVEDAVVAVTLIESSMMGTGLLGSANNVNSSFPEDVQKQYVTQLQTILKVLGLNEVLETELGRIESESNPTIFDGAPSQIPGKMRKLLQQTQLPRRKYCQIKDPLPVEPSFQEPTTSTPQMEPESRISYSPILNPSPSPPPDITVNLEESKFNLGEVSDNLVEVNDNFGEVNDYMSRSAIFNSTKIITNEDKRSKDKVVPINSERSTLFDCNIDVEFSDDEFAMDTRIISKKSENRKLSIPNEKTNIPTSSKNSEEVKPNGENKNLRIPIEKKNIHKTSNNSEEVKSSSECEKNKVKVSSNADRLNKFIFKPREKKEVTNAEMVPVTEKQTKAGNKRQSFDLFPDMDEDLDDIFWKPESNDPNKKAKL